MEGEPEPTGSSSTFGGVAGRLLAVDALDVPELVRRPEVVAGKYEDFGLPVDCWAACKGWKTVFRVVVGL